MNRRDLIALFGSTAAAWSVRARAQQPDRIRRIGVLTAIGADDPEGQVRLTAFVQGLQKLGWTVGQNVRIDYRWGGSNADDTRKYAAELVALAPDVILAQSSASVAPLLLATRTIPVVFTTVADPVGAGFVESLARPGGNATGFTNFEYSIAGKWLELLKEIAPDVMRVAVFRESTIAAGPGQFGAIQAQAQSLDIELRPIDVRDAGEIERATTAFARGSNGGLIVTGSPAAVVHRGLIVALAARHRLPAVYNTRFYATGGGLISYGPDFVDQFRRAAGYVDRILKGEKPADLAVQQPTRYELVINLKTAKALGLDVPPMLLARARASCNQCDRMKRSRAEAAPNVSSSIRSNVEIVIRPPYVSLRDREQKILPALSVRAPNQQSNRRGVPIGGYPSPPVKLIPPLASIDQVKKMIAA